MDTLHIGLGDGFARLALQGAGVAVPVRGALVRETKLLPGDLVEQVFDVVMEGTAAEIENCLLALGRELARAAEEADRPGGQFRYLEARARAGGALLRSKIVRGWVEMLGGDGLRSSGSAGARLHVVRVDFWEAGLTWLPLTNGNGTRVTTGLMVYNHRGSLTAEDNTASASSADALGELPAPALLEFLGVDPTDTGTVYAGQAVNVAPGSMTIEGETGTAGVGVTGTVTNDAAASADQYMKLDWTGAAELTLWKKTIDQLDLYIFGGRPFLPVLRLHTGTAESIWYYWRVTVNFSGVGYVAYDCPGGWLQTSTNHCAGLPLFLPPWPMAENDLPPGVGLELRVKASAAGSHSLLLDCLHLLPLEHWRVYRPSVGSYSGLKITDDPYTGTLKSGTWAIQMHQAEGPGLMVRPGQSNRFVFLMEKSGGGFSAGTRATVRIGYRPRSRGLL